MSSSLDMALDDIISTNKKGNRGGSRGGISKRGGGANNRNNNSQTRRRGAGGPVRNAAPAPRAPAPRAPRAPRNSLVVSNLHPKVTEKDLYELFGQQGDVKRAFLHIGPDGRSAGIADIVFIRAVDAESAKNAYNNVDLDHRPMRISFANLSSSVASTTSSSPRGNGRRNPPRGSPFQRRRPGGNDRNSGSGRPKRENRPKPNQADLDAEMDTYMGQ